MSEQPKGYNLPIKVEGFCAASIQNTLVGCQRCNETWYEEMFRSNNIWINGPYYKYDYCNKCKKENE